MSYQIDDAAKDLVWHDISDEKSRTYAFPGGDTLTVVGPEKLHVSDSGGHRIFREDGPQVYVPAGWLYLTWEGDYIF